MRIGRCVLVLFAVLAVSAPAYAQFATGKNPKVLDRGRGWQLLEIWAEGEDPNQPGTQVWAVSKRGVGFLPVSKYIRDGIAAGFEGSPNKEVQYHHTNLWELLEEDSEGAQKEYPEAFESAAQGCPDQLRHETGSLDESVNVGDRTYDLFDGVSGTLSVDIPVSFSGQYDLAYYKKRWGDWGLCVTVGFRFESLQASGDANLAGTSDASAEVQITGHWEKEWRIANPKIVDTWFWVGPVPVNLEVFIPVDVGLEVDATLTGDLQLNSLFGASGSFDYTCTSDGCSGVSGFQENFDFNDIDMGLELDIHARGFGRVGVLGQIYSDDFAYGYAGVEGYLTGDFWGYFGSTCGDADGDGDNETVSAAVVDVGWGWDIKYEYGGLFIPDGQGTVPGDTGDLGWWDLLGPSTALQPMLLGPEIVETGTSEGYTVQMRPCYPYTDTVNFSLSPSGWNGPSSLTPPAQAAVSRQFDEPPGTLTIGAVNEVDAAGREIWSDYEREIEIIEPCPANTNLTVALTSPDEGDEIVDSLTFVATASDDVGVDQVKFRIDNTIVCTDEAAPWSCTVDVSSYPTGPYALTARAFSVCGNQKTSAPVNVVLNPETCDGDTNLTVALTSPDEGDQISDTLSFAATASDDVGVDQVKFRIDGSVVCTDSTSPYSCIVDVSGYPTGQYSLTARAFGECGNQKTSAPVNVVLNPGPDFVVAVSVVVLDPAGMIVAEVTSTPAGLNCSSSGNPNQCEITVPGGNSITLHAFITDDPIGLGIFENWLGPDCPASGSAASDVTFEVTEDVDCVASFRCDGSVPECIGGP